MLLSLRALNFCRSRPATSRYHGYLLDGLPWTRGFPYSLIEARSFDLRGSRQPERTGQLVSILFFSVSFRFPFHIHIREYLLTLSVQVRSSVSLRRSYTTLFCSSRPLLFGLPPSPTLLHDQINQIESKGTRDATCSVFESEGINVS